MNRVPKLICMPHHISGCYTCKANAYSDALAKVIDKEFKADEARARALPTPTGLLANLSA